MSDGILLVHGQPGGARDWQALRDALGPDGAAAVALERPGWDGSSAPTGLAGNGLAALKALDRLGLPSAVVVGHSFGGAVAAWLAVHHPDRVSGLVLIAPSANLSSLYPLDRWLAAPVAGDLAGAALLGVAGIGLKAGLVRRRLAHLLALDDHYLAETAERLLRPVAWRAFAIEQRALVRELPALESQLHSIRARSLILAGSADRVVPMRSLRLLAEQIPRAELVELAGAGHLMPLLDAARIAAELRRVQTGG